MALISGPASSDMRVATWNASLDRDGPGLLLRDIDRDEPDIRAAIDLVDRADADILVLSGFDFDLGLVAAEAFNSRLARPYPHLFARMPNSGRPTGLDLDGDGRTGDPNDAQGYGRFSGQGGMLVLSRYHLVLVKDFTDLRWRDLPGATLPDTTAKPVRDAQRLSSVVHWVLVAKLPGKKRLTLMTWHATTPVFDGPEDRNGLRNRDENRLWSLYLDGELPGEEPPSSPFVLLGTSNLDPSDGEGYRDTMRELLAHGSLNDVRPASAQGLRLSREQGGANAAHRGNPRFDTADFRDVPGPGNLRVQYLLPSRDLAVVASGILWPDLFEADRPRSRHGLVWADLGG